LSNRLIFLQYVAAMTSSTLDMVINGILDEALGQEKWESLEKEAEQLFFIDNVRSNLEYNIQKFENHLGD
jgi:hypothetical protein